MKKFTLHKKERVKKRKDIEFLFNEGKSFSITPCRVFYFFKKNEDDVIEENPLQFGCGVSKKIFKKAVDRNRIKRLLREGYRLQKLDLLNAVVEKKFCSLRLFIIYTGKEMPDYIFIKEKIFIILQRLQTEVEKLD